MGVNDPKSLKIDFPDNKWKYLTKKLAYSYDYFNSLDGYRKPVDNLKKEDFFSKLKKDYPNERKIERTKEKFIKFNNKNGEELTQLCIKSDVLLLAKVFEKFIKVSINDFGINPLYFISLAGYTWQCCLKYTRTNLRTFQGKDMLFVIGE